MASPSHGSLRRAFYPCCADDIEEPRRLLAGIVDEIIYCDIRRPRGYCHPPPVDGLPVVTFIQRDLNAYVDLLPVVHVFFYRRDSPSEGGSGLYILGKEWLPRILQHLPDEGGLIVTDGSNRGSGVFGKMIRPGGYLSKTWGCQFWPSREQPWLTTHGLHRIAMRRVISPRGS
jgi:hypothetical protein